MSEVGNIDSSSGVAIGERAQAQNVVVNVGAPTPAEISNMTLKEIALSIGRAVQNLEVRFYEWQREEKERHKEDIQERHERQEHYDTHWQMIMERIERLEDTVLRIDQHIHAFRWLSLVLIVGLAGLLVELILRWR